MKFKTAHHLICKSCRVALDLVVRSGTSDTVEHGVAACPRCATGWPVLDGFLHADHPLLLDEVPSLSELQDLQTQLLPRATGYGQRLASHGHRSHDAYAAFQPFNESTRALYPLLEQLRAPLRPGDLILDTWCRTGFSGALLAGLFPQQQVVSLWEGNLGALGWQGFHHWLATRSRPANWDIVFCHPGQGLPFADGSVALLHGLDSLHRYAFQPFLGDCLRVTRQDGALVFPHVHLADSQPEPFFERGGVQLKAARYRRYFHQVLADGPRSAFVLGERALFELTTPAPLQDVCAPEHYNGLVVVLPPSPCERALVPTDPAAVGGDVWPLPNPLLAVDALTGRVERSPLALGGAAAELLARHPCYQARLDACLPWTLTRRQAMAWTWIAAGADRQTLAGKLGWTPAETQAELEAMAAGELVTNVPVGAAMARLQRFHGTRALTPLLADQHFGWLWQGRAARYGSRPLLVGDDGSAFDADDAATVVAALTRWLSARSVGAGDRLVLCAGAHAEAILLVWACWLRGVEVAFIDPATPGQRRAQWVEQLAPRLVVQDAVLSLDDASGVPALWCCATDGERAGAGEGAWLSALLEAHIGGEPLCLPVSEDSPAAILFTSGSTGQPKGVCLTQGALVRGASSLAHAYALGADDVMASPGGLHAMSGLRNSCVLPLLAGATLATIDPRHFVHPRSAAAACRQHGITTLTVVPAFVLSLRAAVDPLSFGRLRQMLCTGSLLPLAAQRDVEQRLGVPVRVYYGLTESGGVCTLVPTDEARLADGDIGRPVDAQCRCSGPVTLLSSPAAPVYELEVHGANLMTGYVNDLESSLKRLPGGWLRTGDLVRIEGGHLILCGRVDDLFKTRNGTAVHPAAVEEALHARDDVVEAVALGVDTPSGPQLHVWVVPRDVHDAGWQQRLLAGLATEIDPQCMPGHLHGAQDLPRNSNGKVDRAALRATLNIGKSR